MYPDYRRKANLSSMVASFRNHDYGFGYWGFILALIVIGLALNLAGCSPSHGNFGPLSQQVGEIIND